MSKRQRIIFTVLVFFSLFPVAFFAIWWFRPLSLPDNFDGRYQALDLILFVLVSYVIWHPIVMSILNWSIASHIKRRGYAIPQSGLRVAAITTFVPGAESVELLHKTLPALVRMRYRHDTWLLDESDHPMVKTICEKYGVYHFSRKGIDIYNSYEGKFVQRTKGGNHNSWYDQIGTQYDIVAQMDTDFIAKEDYLVKTLGFFRDKDVAFVGTPQVYGNTADSLIAKGAAQQTYSFYGPILRGMDGMDTTMLIGANHVIRVSALENVDLYSAHITEDLLTGMKIHAGGWKSIYVPEPLAIGEGPTSWKAYFNQQKRWAYGCMHILFNHSPKLFRNMRSRRTIYYFLLQQHYFTGLAMAISLLCLSLYYLFGIETTTTRLSEFIIYYAPVLVTTLGVNYWLQRFNVRPKIERGIHWAGMFVSVAAWPIFFAAFLELFKTQKLAFKVTPKGSSANKSSKVFIGQFLPHLTIGLLALGELISAPFTGRNSPIMIFWAISTSGLMLLVPIIIPISKASRRSFLMVQSLLHLSRKDA